MAYEGIKNFIMARLGYPRVKVYMTPEQIDTAIWEAIDRYFEYTDVDRRWTYISGIPEQDEFDLPTDVVPKYIIQVVFKPSDPLLSLTGVMQDVYLLYYLQSAGGASNFIVDYWMTLASYEEYIRVLGNQPHWSVVENSKLKIDPKPSVPFTIGVEYSVLPAETIIENTRWIRLYSLAAAKEIEGEIRSKFSSFQAGSGEISLNGDALKSEAQNERMKLEEELFNKQSFAGIMTIG